MFHLVHGPGSTQRKAVAVIVGYFDDSNTHSGSKIVSLCGFLADIRWWEDFHQEWQRVLDNPQWPNRPREFHTVDIVHRTGEFADWSLAQRLAIFGDMTSVIAKSNIIAIGSLCVTDAFYNRTPFEQDLLARGGFSSPMDVVFQFLLGQVIFSTRQYGQTHTPAVQFEEIGLVFDEAPAPTARRFLEQYDHIKQKHPYGKMLSGISFRSSEKLSPIQAADMLAYTTYYWQFKQLFPSDREFDFPVIPGFQRLIDNVASAGGIYNENAMRQLIAQETINKVNKEARFEFEL
jgi:hypothetical protein